MTTTTMTMTTREAIHALGALICVIGFVAAVGTIIYGVYEANNVQVICNTISGQIVCSDNDSDAKLELVWHWSIGSLIVGIAGRIIMAASSEKKEKEKEKKKGGSSSSSNSCYGSWSRCCKGLCSYA